MAKKTKPKRRTKKKHITATPSRWRDNLESDGLIVEVGTSDMSPKNALKMAKKIAGELRGEWQVTPMGKESRDFLYRKPEGTKNPTAAMAWDLAYQLSEHRDVAECAPSLFIPVGGIPEMQSTAEARQAREFASSSGGGDDDDKGGLPCSDPKQWSLTECRVKAAWDLTPPNGGKSKGQGIVIGHPDTGYTRHPEIDSNRLLSTKGHDFEADEADPDDDLSGPFGGHGTSTSSVIFSSEALDVTGSAPKAKARTTSRHQQRRTAFLWTTSPGFALRSGQRPPRCFD